MRYSPTCRIDYDDDVEECVISGGPLIEGSSREIFEDVPEEQWVELDPLPSLSHAVKVLEVLDEEQIPSYIEAVMSGSNMDGYSAIILVPDAEFDRALEIQQGLAAPDDGDLLYDPNADDY